MALLKAIKGEWMEGREIALITNRSYFTVHRNCSRLGKVGVVEHRDQPWFLDGEAGYTRLYRIAQNEPA